MNMIKLFGKPIRVNMSAADRRTTQDIGAKLFVGNLDLSIDDKLLYDAFGAFGSMVQTPQIARDQLSGNSRGFAFVSYTTFEAADLAIQSMDGQYLANKPINVKYAFKKDAKGERHGSAAERMLAAEAHSDSDYEQQIEPQALSAEELAVWALQGAIRIRCHNFVFVTLRSSSVRNLYGVFATIKYFSCVSLLKSLYAFKYHTDSGKDIPAKHFDLRTEFQRMGVGNADGVSRYWRFSESNRKFQLCATYPPLLVVPSKISDATLTYVAWYRSKARLPALCYLHPNGFSMTRSSQPMVGLQQARSVQDEKLVEAILATSEPTGTPPPPSSSSII
ncbi:Splicing factor 3B subunit 4 [Coemansia sp. RSA 1821]|nr:Splicing factor 3B subunit 4 [Coemansia sp. RSA 1821]